MTQIEKRDSIINNLVDSIKESLSRNLVTTRTTCADAPNFGWSLEEFMYMPLAAQRLREEGYQATSSVNFGVTDWKLSL